MVGRRQVPARSNLLELSRLRVRFLWRSQNLRLRWTIPLTRLVLPIPQVALKIILLFCDWLIFLRDSVLWEGLGTHVCVDWKAPYCRFNFKF